MFSNIFCKFLCLLNLLNTMSKPEDNRDNPVDNEGTTGPAEKVELEGRDSVNVDKISARLPNFWPDSPELYFISIEASFKLSNISSEATKFLSLIAALDQQTMLIISDLIRTPDPLNPYTVVKQRLIKEFAVSEVRRIQTVLNDLCLGDMKPSAFLRRMREQAGSGFSETGLKSIWLSHMPTAVQSILSTIDKDLSGLAEVADKIFDVASFDKSQFCEAIKQTSTADCPSFSGLEASSTLQNQIDELKKETQSIHAKLDKLLKNQSFRPRSRARSFSRRSAEVKQSNRSDLCWYHDKYADKANNCIKPCSYEPKN